MPWCRGRAGSIIAARLCCLETFATLAPLGYRSLEHRRCSVFGAPEDLLIERAGLSVIMHGTAASQRTSRSAMLVEDQSSIEGFSYSVLYLESHRRNGSKRTLKRLLASTVMSTVVARVNMHRQSAHRWGSVQGVCTHDHFT